MLHLILTAKEKFFKEEIHREKTEEDDSEDEDEDEQEDEIKSKFAMNESPLIQ